MTMFTKQVRVTPAMAQQWLSASTTRNRSISKALVTSLSFQMSTGQWRTNGETVILDQHGNILDGHHRLRACVQSGVPFETLVVYGAPADCLTTIDTGKARSAADAMAFAGYANVTNAATTARLVWLAERDRLDDLSSNHTRVGLTHDAIVDVMRRHSPALVGAISSAGRFHREFRHLSRSKWAFLAYWLPRLDDRNAEGFMEGLLYGAGLAKDDPRYVLRERLRKNGENSTSKFTEDVVVAFVIKAWNLYRRGAKCNILKWTKEGHSAEAFPKFEPHIEPYTD